jgi:hypothetical protein
MLEILKMILSKISNNVYGKNYMWGNERSKTFLLDVFWKWKKEKMKPFFLIYPQMKKGRRKNNVSWSGSQDYSQPARSGRARRVVGLERTHQRKHRHTSAVHVTSRHHHPPPPPPPLPGHIPANQYSNQLIPKCLRDQPRVLKMNSTIRWSRWRNYGCYDATYPLTLYVALTSNSWTVTKYSTPETSPRELGLCEIHSYENSIKNSISNFCSIRAH